MRSVRSFRAFWRWGVSNGIVLGAVAGFVFSVQWDDLSSFLEPSKNGRDFTWIIFLIAGGLAGLVLASIGGVALLLAQHLLPPSLRGNSLLMAGVAATVAVLPLDIAALMLLPSLPAVYQVPAWYINVSALVLWVALAYASIRALNGSLIRPRSTKTRAGDQE